MNDEQPQRFDAGAAAALLGAVLLFVSPFLPWFEPGGNAWQLFELLDVVLLVLALGAGVLSVRRVLAVGDPGDPRVLPALGGAALLLILATVLEPPPLVADAGVRSGAWIAFAGAILILGGGVLDLIRVSVTVSVAGKTSDPPAAPGRSAPAGTAPPTPGHSAPAESPRESAPADSPTSLLTDLPTRPVIRDDPPEERA